MFVSLLPGAACEIFFFIVLTDGQLVEYFLRASVLYLYITQRQVEQLQLLMVFMKISPGPEI